MFSIKKYDKTGKFLSHGFFGSKKPAIDYMKTVTVNPETRCFSYVLVEISYTGKGEIREIYIKESGVRS